MYPLTPAPSTHTRSSEFSAKGLEYSRFFTALVEATVKYGWVCAQDKFPREGDTSQGPPTCEELGVNPTSYDIPGFHGMAPCRPALCPVGTAVPGRGLRTCASQPAFPLTFPELKDSPFQTPGPSTLPDWFLAHFIQLTCLH